MDRRKRKLTKAERKVRSLRMIGKQIHLGHRHSLETKETIGLKSSQRIRTDEEKQKTRERMTGNQLRTGKTYAHTIYTKRLISEKLTGIQRDKSGIDDLIPIYLRVHPRVFSEVFR